MKRLFSSNSQEFSLPKKAVHFFEKKTSYSIRNYFKLITNKAKAGGWNVMYVCLYLKRVCVSITEPKACTVGIYSK